jgi:hypothetical protein
VHSGATAPDANLEYAAGKKDADITLTPHLFSDLRILKDFKSFVFGSADCKGVTGGFFGSADSKEVSLLGAPNSGRKTLESEERKRMDGAESLVRISDFANTLDDNTSVMWRQGGKY